MSDKNQTKIVDARSIAEDIDTMTRELESLVNGKQGFLKDIKKHTNDIGVQRLNEDIFALKQLSKRVLDIMCHIESMDRLEDEEDNKFNKERFNNSNKVYR